MPRFAALLMLMLSTACAPPPLATRCNVHSDCPAGYCCEETLRFCYSNPRLCPAPGSGNDAAYGVMEVSTDASRLPDRVTAPMDAAGDGGGGAELAPVDAGSWEASTPDSSGVDTSVNDSGAIDSARIDTGRFDLGAADVSPADAHARDSGPGRDATPRDATLPEGGNPGGLKIFELDLGLGDPAYGDLVVYAQHGDGVLYLYDGADLSGGVVQPTPAAEIHGTPTCRIASPDPRYEGGIRQFEVPMLLVDADNDGHSDLLFAVDCQGATRLAVALGPITFSSVTVDDLQLHTLPAGTLRKPFTLGVGSFVDGQTLDLAVGFPLALDQDGLATTGVVHVYKELANLASEPAPYAVIEGENDGKLKLGGALNYGGGDLNADGYDDLMIGASVGLTGNNNSDAAYLLLGPIPAGSSRVADLYRVKFDGTDCGWNGNGGSCHAGRAVGFIDMDLDGALEVFVAADREESYYRANGRIYLYRGLHNLQSGTQDIYVARPKSDSDPTGYDLFVSGDDYQMLGSIVVPHQSLDADGQRDLIAWGVGINTCCERGQLYGAHANPGFQSVSPPGREAPNPDFVIYGSSTSLHWGRPAGVGDVNADGCDDFAVGYGAWNSGQGRVQLFHGCKPERADGYTGTSDEATDVFLLGPDGVTGFGEAVLTR